MVYGCHWKICTIKKNANQPTDKKRETKNGTDLYGMVEMIFTTPVSTFFNDRVEFRSDSRGERCRTGAACGICGEFLAR